MMDKVKKWAVPALVIGGITILALRWALTNARTQSLALKALGLGGQTPSN